VAIIYKHMGFINAKKAQGIILGNCRDGLAPLGVFGKGFWRGVDHIRVRVAKLHCFEFLELDSASFIG
jgi:hypothetical protein